jgi:hypothetical protein
LDEGAVARRTVLAPQVAGGRRGEAARMNDLDIARHFESRVAEEQSTQAKG